MVNWLAVLEPQQLPEGFQRSLKVLTKVPSVHGFKKSYLNELRAKRLREEEDLTVEELPLKKRGRPLLLGKKLDEVVQQYIIKLREHGCPINTVIVLAIARGIVKSMERTQLAEYGGPTTLTTPWAKSL